ncbi:unnamed protein product [Cylicocyclus nassatus]|uniref:Uncharacterized protein n=1 Tax=Cylicocyclus nassatus TaxID=53992 RepID=A0AA36M4E5_CYLNA|nr:unnamed protein product [Cylicocyclus nassatus]
MCTIFMEGAEWQIKGTNVYAFERGSVMPICSPISLNVDRPTTATALGARTTTTAPRARPPVFQIRPIQANPVMKNLTGVNSSYSFIYYQDQPHFCKPTMLCLYRTKPTVCYVIGSGELCRGFVLSEYCEEEATYPVATYIFKYGMECYTVVHNQPDPTYVFPEIPGYALLSKFFVRSIIFYA